MDAIFELEAFHCLAVCLGGRDVLRFGMASLDSQRALSGVALDFHTSLSADCRLSAQALCSLGHMAKMHRFYISRLRVQMDVVTRCGGAELVALAAPCMRVLDFSHTKSLIDVYALGYCTFLEELNISFCRDLKHLKGLERCIRLSTLSASNCDSLADLSALSTCARLRTLVLSFCRSVQLETFPALPMAKLVWAESCLEDCMVMSRFPKLIELNLTRSNNLINIEGLSACPLLKDLDLFSCGRISSTMGLQHLQQLEALNLSTCMHLVSINDVEALPKLKTLNLNRCMRIQDFSPLARCRSLLSVSLHGCKLKPDFHIEQSFSDECDVSTSVEMPLKHTGGACVERAALASLRRGAYVDIPRQVQHAATCSSNEAKLRSASIALNVTLGIFWEDTQGSLSFAGAYLRTERAKFAMAFIAGSQICTFRHSVGVPGRAFSNGTDWIDDVQALDTTAFPRQPAAVIAGVRTVFAVAVPGGVAEFGYDTEVTRTIHIIDVVVRLFESALDE